MTRKSVKDNLLLLNKHIQRHNMLMIIATSIVAGIALLFCLFWQFDPNDISDAVDYSYLFGNIAFLVISVALLALLIISRFVKFKSLFLVVAIHIYIFLLLGWGTAVCVMDLRFGFSPLFYLILFTIAAGLFVVEPLYFTAIIAGSVTTIVIMAFHDGSPFFAGFDGTENMIAFVVYIIVIALVGFEHFGITINDYHIESRLEQLTYYDDLTGLLNERSYLQEIEQLDKLVNEGKITKFAVILMDLNNIKATNDTYGHRFGCHLIVRCGKELPKYFETSSLFHIGGDEFVAIVYDKDYDYLDKIVDKFSEKLTYSKITYEGIELVFSVAHGVGKYEAGMKYRDVLQKADDAMYENKKFIKDKYNLKHR